MKKGFTLVELLAVIIIIGLIMAIAVPGSLTIAAKVKEKAYQTKIELIEKSAEVYGVDIVDEISNENKFCVLNQENNEIKSISYNQSSSTDSYNCKRYTVNELIGTNNLDYDEKNYCKDKCISDDDKKNYDNMVYNPLTNNVINRCYVYLYIKNNRAYAYFDRQTCDNIGNLEDGHEYKKKVFEE